ncbi:chemotaxis protein CheB [Luteibacter sp. 329MFSha]|uniref:chemotaxis protein CheB n=1 Tax=Luteibacter sp. 329MFSha TaxID=1798239 RepID=UPI0008C4BAB9|nr:chemotaxis protein CheB [Luteibacter sp. 329MFSha]SEV84412.1 two-component system, chemotaxis family, response regulator CheB [Luteibacter sp. 329MFSha]
MVDRQATVALLFDDEGLSAHLREALVAQGARIVYESDLKSFAPAELVGSSADVVVVDLDDPGDDDLDRLYDTVEGGHPRLVFNDADASRQLQGWDRARWARHLAAKLVGEIALDPPRPDDARAIEPRVSAIAGIAAPSEELLAEPLVDDLAITGSHGYPDAPAPAPAPVDAAADVAFDEVSGIEADRMDDLDFSTPLDVVDDEGQGADPTELAAELEALLADTGSGPIGGDDIESIASSPVELTELASLDLSGFEVVEDEPLAAAPVEREFDVSRFSLASIEESAPPPTDAALPTLDIESRATEYVPPPVPEWDLVDHDAVVVQPVDRAPPAEFGIETLSAAEFLAQDVVDDGTHGLEAGLSLELVSMEEAVAPPTDGAFSHEMFLEGASRAVRRVVVVGGTHESEASIASFLAALPSRVPAVLIVAAHHHGDADALAARLGRGRVATDRSHVNHGDCLVVPRGSHVQVRRDGSVTLHDDGSSANATGPSIDGILSTLAGGFGADALAIVFAGQGNDAVAGAQAVYDGGGRVWVETVPPEFEAGHMVTGIREERVAGFAGDARALAQKLIEEFP